MRPGQMHLERSDDPVGLSTDPFLGPWHPVADALLPQTAKDRVRVGRGSGRQVEVVDHPNGERHQFRAFWSVVPYASANPATRLGTSAAFRVYTTSPSLAGSSSSPRCTCTAALARSASTCHTALWLEPVSTQEYGAANAD